MVKSLINDEIKNCSDRFCFRDLNDKSVVAAVIPKSAIIKLMKLRKRGILPTPPRQVIINTHGELGIDFQVNSKRSEHFVSSLMNVELTDHMSVNKEVPIETLDLYVSSCENNCTLRLRYYINKSGDIYSSRVILADTEPRKSILWRYGNFVVKARSECIYVVKEYSHKGNVKKLIDSTKRFLELDGKIIAIVHKHVFKGNFGKETMWDHRKAIYNDFNGNPVDATSSLSVLGMGDYISYNAQVVRKIIQNIPKNNVYCFINKFLTGYVKSGRCFSCLGIRKPDMNFRIELECKGDKYCSEGAYVVKQLIGGGGILDRHRIGFAIARDRRVSN